MNNTEYLKIDKINEALKTDPEAVIMLDEQRFFERLIKLADTVLQDKKNKIILLSGPSGSGKTTSSQILKKIFESNGVDTAIISLDNFYKRPEDMPKLPSGEPDFESVHSIDTDEIHNDFIELIQYGSCDIPVFDFLKGKRIEKAEHIQLRPGGLAIVEGIHALNPLISQTLPRENLFSVYISIENGYESESGEIKLHGRDLRLIRRLIRDYKYRNSSAENTLRMWPGVIHGEEKYLFPNKNRADYTINSLHSYEAAVFKDEALQLLAGIGKSSEYYKYVKDIVEVLPLFVGISQDLVPSGSLLHEFI
ncbi:MAG TPA: nucleoside kinase [Clostridiales bacterium]|nr:nucleoside kinase [Clostridiales bacterium]